MKAFILLIALLGLVSCIYSRPIVYTAILTNGAIEEDVSTAFGLVTFKKGEDYRRMRVFGAFSNKNKHIISSAWVVDSLGTKLLRLRLGNDTSLFGARFYYGDVRLNRTLGTALLSDQIYIALFDKANTPVMMGNMFSNPQTAIAYMDPEQVVPPVSNRWVGIGMAHIKLPTATTTNVDELFSIYNSVFPTDVVMVHEVKTATSASLYTNAGRQQNGELLIPFQNFNGQKAIHLDTAPGPNIMALEDTLTYFQLASEEYPLGAIRGQLMPTLRKTRSLAMTQFQLRAGDAVVPNELRTLAKANNPSEETKPDSILEARTRLSDGTSYSFVGDFYFTSPIPKKSAEQLRGLTLETNLQQTSPTTWQFSIYDKLTGGFIPLGTYSAAGLTYTRGESRYFRFDTSKFVMDDNNMIVVRVTATSEGPASLNIDQLGLRAYIPNGIANEQVKALAREANIMSYKI